MPLDLASFRYMMRRLFPWRLLFYDPDILAHRLAKKLTPYDEACEHTWYDAKPDLIRWCASCGRIEGRRREEETPVEFYDRIMHPRCPTCGKPEKE